MCFTEVIEQFDIQHLPSDPSCCEGKAFSLIARQFCVYLESEHRTRKDSFASTVERLTSSINMNFPVSSMGPRRVSILSMCHVKPRVKHPERIVFQEQGSIVRQDHRDWPE
jgi:hypothetical protein